MDDIMGTVSQLMSDPNSKQKIMELAQSLGLGGGSGNVATQNDPALSSQDAPGLGNMLPNLGNIMNSNKDPRMNLLNAVKPFLSDKRTSTIDNISRLIQVGGIVSTMGIFNNKNGGK
jgi:hypothetical protein